MRGFLTTDFTDSTDSELGKVCGLGWASRLPGDAVERLTCSKQARNSQICVICEIGG
jgi:hypothetical protein